MNKKSIIIVGGGIASLVAARQLALYNEVIILEALPHFGGRIRTITDSGFPAAIEAGAEFVHGEAQETIKLLDEAGITFTAVAGEFYRKQNAVLEIQNEMVEGWDLLMKKMGGITEDLSLQEFLDIHFSATQFAGLHEQAIAFAEGFDLADKDRVSVQSLYQEWSHQGTDHRVNGGYSRLIQFLAADCERRGCKLITNSIVKDIEWSNGQVQVFTAAQTRYTAAQCLVTVPVGILQQTDGAMALNFVPPIPGYLAAVNEIGFGSVIKIILTFNKKFWKEDGGFFFGEEAIPTWWTQLPEQSPVLTGWAGGPAAAALNTSPEEQVLEKALESLAGIFNLSIAGIREMLSAWKVFNWKDQPSASGAYSYATTKTLASLKILNTPIQNTLYFAGEGLYAGEHPGTVEAAVVTAQRVVKLLLQART